MANKEELERRISAFCKRKRDELDRTNLLEFCNLQEDGVGDSCARVAAMLCRKSGSKSHLRTSSVKNVIGPHSNGIEQSRETEVKKIKLEFNSVDQTSVLPVSLENRFSELEKKVTFGENKPMPMDIYTRLKILEDRIVMLEGISPEYFNPVLKENFKNEKEEVEEIRRKRKAQVKGSLSELDERIFILKNLLKTQIIKAELDSD